jgi:hypothetical protein
VQESPYHHAFVVFWEDVGMKMKTEELFMVNTGDEEKDIETINFHISYLLEK